MFPYNSKIFFLREAAKKVLFIDPASIPPAPSSLVAAFLGVFF